MSKKLIVWRPPSFYGLMILYLLFLPRVYAEPIEELHDDRSDEEIQLAKKKLQGPQKPQTKRINKRKIKKKYIYQWQDEKGNTVISDRPHKGAIAIELPKTQTYRAPALSRQIITTENNPSEKIDNEDKTPPVVTILTPQDDSWLPNNNGDVSIKIGLDPFLGRGQELIILVDGVKKNIASSPSISLKNMSRGEHVINAIIKLSASKKELSNQKSVFYVKRPVITRKK